MAHLTSFKSSGAVGILRHDERREFDEVQSRKNECIDPARTHLNYNLAPKRNGTLMNHIQQVCQDNNIRLSNRKDLNVMCSWVITAPKTIPEEQLSKFFECCYNFMTSRYGVNNTLSAAVHLDETTPHIHYCFIPVGHDQKNDRLTVSSKLVATRTELRSFQQDLSRTLEQEFGFNVGILNEATKNGNQTIEQLKQKSKLDAEIIESRTEIEQLAEQSSILTSESFKIQTEVNSLKSEKNRLEHEIKPLKACFDRYSDIENAGKTKLGGKVVLSAEEASKLKEQACSYWSAKTMTIQAKDEIKALHGRYDNIDDTVRRLQYQNRMLMSENQQLKRHIKHVDNVLESNPDLMEQFNKQSEQLTQDSLQALHSRNDFDLSF